jgi:hypothetical protein
MFDSKGENESGQERGKEAVFSRRRLLKMVGGAIVALLLGLGLVCTFTYIRYGGTPLDRVFGWNQPQKSPATGKLAFNKGTKYYIGVIKGEGASPRRGKVYYIEQSGGFMVEIPRDLVEVREPEKNSEPPGR